MCEERNMEEGCPPGWWMIESEYSCGMSIGVGGISSVLGGGRNSGWNRDHRSHHRIV